LPVPIGGIASIAFCSLVIAQMCFDSEEGQALPHCTTTHSLYSNPIPR
jgi:hypothetical protein